jgi:integrase
MAVAVPDRVRRCSLDGHRKRQQRDRVAAGSAWQVHGLAVTTIGTPIENIQDVLGHSSPTATKMIYVEVTEKIQREATDRLGYLFDEGDDG